jgi:hypothetical protein
MPLIASTIFMQRSIAQFAHYMRARCKRSGNHHLALIRQMCRGREDLKYGSTKPFSNVAQLGGFCDAVRRVLNAERSPRGGVVETLLHGTAGARGRASSAASQAMEIWQ